jgi:hypothetical protein
MLLVVATVAMEILSQPRFPPTRCQKCSLHPGTWNTRSSVISRGRVYTKDEQHDMAYGAATRTRTAQVKLTAVSKLTEHRSHM